MRTVIDKMAEYVSRNGSAFEKLMRERERNNPKLQFIFEVQLGLSLKGGYQMVVVSTHLNCCALCTQGHEFNPYYEWKLATLLGHAEPQDGGAGGMSHAPAPAESYQDQTPQASNGPLSPQERIQLGALLEALDGTKDPIKVRRPIFVSVSLLLHCEITKRHVVWCRPERTGSSSTGHRLAPLRTNSARKWSTSASGTRSFSASILLTTFFTTPWHSGTQQASPEHHYADSPLLTFSPS
jgi:hypothetical protein